MIGKLIAHQGAESRQATVQSIVLDEVRHDLNIGVIDMSGITMAHGEKKQRIGKSPIAFKNADGKRFIQESIQVANGKDPG